MKGPEAVDRKLMQAQRHIRSGETGKAFEICRDLAEGRKNPQRRALDLYQKLYRRVHGEPTPHAHVFDHIYRWNLWGGGSGKGSTPEHTEAYRKFLQEFIGSRGIRSIVDAGCGDWQFMKLMDLRGVDYLGIDVSRVVMKTARLHAAEGVRFAEGDVRRMRLPSADLLLMKDVFQHWTNDDILDFIPQLAKFRYCLLTNDLALRRPERMNRDIAAGAYRSLDPAGEPFHVPGEHVFSFKADKPKSVFLVRGTQVGPLLRARISVQRLLRRVKARLGRGRGARP